MGFSQLCEAWIMEDNPNHDPSNGEFSSTVGANAHSEETTPDPNTVARVRSHYTSGYGRKSCMENFKITEQQLDDILSGKYGKGKIAAQEQEGD